MGNFLGSAGRNNINILGSGLIHVVVESVGRSKFSERECQI